jgi:hypothetical protein
MTDNTLDQENGSMNPIRRENVPIDELVLDKVFQVRTKLNEKAIRQYKDAYRSDRQLDAIRVADVDGALILVDGWHRVTALQQLGKSMVEAEITPMSRDDALWAASIANVKHGVPLSKDDHLKIFVNYMATGRHIKRDTEDGPEYKSYRELENDIPIHRSHATIRNWMIDLYPDVARAIGGSEIASAVKEPKVDSCETVPMERRETVPMERRESANALSDANPGDSACQGTVHVKLIDDLLGYFNSGIEPEERGLIIGDVRDLLCTMENSPGWTSPALECIDL